MFFCDFEGGYLFLVLVMGGMVQYIFVRQVYSLTSMQRIHRYNTDNLHDQYPTNPLNKSPIKRNNVNQMHPARSPIRSRTPTRNVSPLRTTSPLPSSIKYISHMSPVRQKVSNVENNSELSNGKGIKYINHHFNDKKYQTGRKERPIDSSKRIDKIQGNRLFGKMVQKIQSGKKSGNKGQEGSYKTSVFQNSDAKVNRMEQTSGRNQGGVNRQLFAQVINTEPRSERRMSTLTNQNDTTEQTEGLSCLVYKIGSHAKPQKEEFKQKAIDSSKTKDTTNAAMPSILAKRRFSKQQQQNNQPSQPMAAKRAKKVEQSQDYSVFNAFLQKIETIPEQKGTVRQQDLVKMSLGVQESLDMSPFI